MRLCIICKSRPAAVPDRMRTGKPIKRVCKECHSQRLRGDLVKIIEANINKYQRQLSSRRKSEATDV
jgi:hypothetical protein